MMPIAQERLIDLLSAALDWEQAFHTLVRRISYIADNTNESWAREIAKSDPSSFLRNPIKTSTTIASEKERIRLTKRYNDRRREKNKEPAPLIPELDTETASINDAALKVARHAGFSTIEEFMNDILRGRRHDDMG
jgi:hypothetical protein